MCLWAPALFNFWHHKIYWIRKLYYAKSLFEYHYKVKLMKGETNEVETSDVPISHDKTHAAGSLCVILLRIFSLKSCNIIAVNKFHTQKQRKNSRKSQKQDDLNISPSTPQANFTATHYSHKLACIASSIATFNMVESGAAGPPWRVALLKASCESWKTCDPLRIWRCMRSTTTPRVITSPALITA